MRELVLERNASPVCWNPALDPGPVALGRALRNFGGQAYLSGIFS